jgi:hippurate hydrolase
MSGIDLAGRLSPDLIAEAVSWRHHLHKHPELAFNERQTADFIASQLGQFGLTVHRGLGGTGVVSTLTSGTSQRTIAIRADMGALPIEEQSGVPHTSSTRGIMHACGHDGHVAMALAAARVCARLPDLDGTVHFIFQPAEEGECGARRMIEEGLFRLFPCDAVYALHNWPALPLGSCVARDGAMLAASAVFEVVISGRGCHGAMPHEGTDSILAGCQLVSSLQSIASRNIDPLEASVVSVTQVHAGSAWSVIPESSVIRGTTRWFDSRIGDVIERRMIELSKAIAAGFGCEAQISYDRRYPATINDSAAASFVRTVADAIPNLTVVNRSPSMGSEDFAEMLQAVPGCYLWLGAGKSGNDHGLHSPCYDFNDELLPLGAALWISLVRKSLHTV